MADVVGDGSHSFYNRLETFNNFKGMPDPILLAKLGYFHMRDDIIICKNCRIMFHSCDTNSAFWIKHKESLCKFIDKDFEYFGSNEHNQTVEQWLKKKQIKDFIQFDDNLTEEKMKKILNNYFFIKGDSANINTFKDYLFFIQNFK